MADAAQAELIARTAQATSAAVAAAIGNLKIQSTPQHWSRLQKFHGKPAKPGDLTVTEWLQDLEVYCRQACVNAADKAQTLIDHLGGKARDEVLCATDQVQADYDQLVDLMRRRFGPAETLPSLTQAFGVRVRQEGESLTDYSRALMRLYSRMERAAPSKDDKAALQRLRDLTLKGQFKKGVGDAMVLKDLERMEIRDPGQSFASMREEILRLYPGLENVKVKVRSVGANVEVDEYFSDPPLPLEDLHVNSNTNNNLVRLGKQQTADINAPSSSVGLDPSVKALLEANRETNQRLDKLLGIMAQHVGPTVANQCDYGQPGARSYRQASNFNPNRRNCFYCGAPGHFKRDCYARTNDERTARTQGNVNSGSDTMSTPLNNPNK